MPSVMEVINTENEFVSRESVDPVAASVRSGLSAPRKTLPPWLFYDERGSQLFEQITTLPEYYLTRTERGLFQRHAADILEFMAAPVTVVELGAGSASKTGLLLQAAAQRQGKVLYQPIDVSPTALDEACAHLEAAYPGVTVQPQVANYVTEPVRIERVPGHKVLALYIGSSIGNFSPEEARSILRGLRLQLQPEDALLLGTDLAPGAGKPASALVAAYDDAQRVTAAFNRNLLTRLNRDLGANFNVDAFRHQARWNAAESRIEMHLESTCAQTVRLPANAAGPALLLRFAEGETIHTENSYKFTAGSVRALVADAGFAVAMTLADDAGLFAVTLATAV